MITNPDWLKPKEKPYFHQISLDYIEKLVEFIERFSKGEINADTFLKMEKEILADEIDDEEFLEFAIENLDELFLYIINGNSNISIHRDIEGKMWFGVGRYENKLDFCQYYQWFSEGLHCVRH